MDKDPENFFLTVLPMRARALNVSAGDFFHGYDIGAHVAANACTLA